MNKGKTALCEELDRSDRARKKLKILSTGAITYLELCGKSMGTGVENVSFEHIAGDDVILNLKLRLKDFEFLPDGYFDEVLRKLGGEPPESKRLK